MPIKPALRWYYPIDWPELSAEVRFDCAGGRCEDCRRPHGQVIHHLGDGRWFDPENELWRDDRGTVIAWPDYSDYTALRKMLVVQAAAHLDHDPSNNRLNNLMALCQRCLCHDRREHRRRTHHRSQAASRSMGLIRPDVAREEARLVS